MYLTCIFKSHSMDYLNNILRARFFTKKKMEIPFMSVHSNIIRSGVSHVSIVTLTFRILLSQVDVYIRFIRSR